MKHKRFLIILRNIFFVVIIIYFCNTFKNIIRFRNINAIDSVNFNYIDFDKRNELFNNKEYDVLSIEEITEIYTKHYKINKNDWNIIIKYISSSIYDNGQFSIFNIFGYMMKVPEPTYTFEINYKKSNHTNTIKIWNWNHFKINGFWQYHIGNEKALLDLTEKYIGNK